MVYATFGKKFNEGKIAKIRCAENKSLKNILIKDKCFLLIVLTSGKLKFTRAEMVVDASAPCFICFNEEENPKIISKNKAEYFCIYFHPDFLNINMTFELIRSKKYGDIAQTHNMFLLKPFVDNCFVVPISHSFTEKITEACFFLQQELNEQRDWYWSCRGRSYFMEIIIALERMCGLIGYGEKDKSPDTTFLLKNQKLRDTVLFIEGNYMRDIALRDICLHSGINHTTLTRLIKAETGMTVLQYLYFYRTKIAKKQLEFTSVPIKDIAARTGFKTVQHFNRIFTKHIGETPAAFRKNAVQKRKDEMR